MGEKFSKIWNRVYNKRMARGLRRAARKTADRVVEQAVNALLKKHETNKDAKSTGIVSYADGVMLTLQQCVNASLCDVQNGAGQRLAGMLCMAAQQAQDPPLAQARHHHIRCEVTRIKPGLDIASGATFYWREPGDAPSPSWNGVVTRRHDGEQQTFDAIAYGPCPPIDAIIEFHAPAIVISDDAESVTVSPVRARVVSIRS